MGRTAALYRQLCALYSIVHLSDIQQHIPCVLFIAAFATAYVRIFSVSTEIGFLPLLDMRYNKAVASNFVIIFLKPYSVTNPRGIPLTE